MEKGGGEKGKNPRHSKRPLSSFLLWSCPRRSSHKAIPSIKAHDKELGSSVCFWVLFIVNYNYNTHLCLRPVTTLEDGWSFVMPKHAAFTSVYSSLYIEVLKNSQNSTPAEFLPYTVVDCQLHSAAEISHTKVTDDSSNSSAAPQSVSTWKWAHFLHNSFNSKFASIFSFNLCHETFPYSIYIYIRFYSQIKFLFAKILHDSTMRINVLQVCPLLILFLFLSL